MNMTSHDDPTTEFAPAERAEPDTLRRRIDDAGASIHAHNLCDTVHSITVFLNRRRQTVFCNRCLLDTLEVPDPDRLFGRRPGELLGCIHAHKTPGGCGTTEHCRTCGAVLIKNALEASSRGEVITVGCEDDAETVRFWVRNPRPMPRDVQLQVFQRSFSTKGRNRGIGTYGMKLLTERYLGGRVGFSSDPHAGTRFWAAYPKRFPAS